MCFFVTKSKAKSNKSVQTKCPKKVDPLKMDHPSKELRHNYVSCVQQTIQ